MEPCISKELREILMLLDNPNAIKNVINVAATCGEPLIDFQGEIGSVPSAINVDPLACSEAYDRIQRNILKASWLIAQGAPPELDRVLTDLFTDIGTCTTTPIIKKTRELFADVKKVTVNTYYKAEGRDLRKRLDILMEEITNNCKLTGCLRPEPPMMAPTIRELMTKLGL